ncbi:MAG TPA: cell division protein FtsQ [Gammaproteobacteria bacterium]|nr:cell division protein FtsQ [Gammaproteobacteria bacterium]
MRIDIQEQQPVAILKDTGLLNLDGKVFTRNTTSYKEILPVFVVAKGYAPEAVKQYKKNKDILQKDGLQVRIYYYDERKSQSIRLTNGIELVLGRKDVEDRLQKFVKAYDAYLKHDKAIKKIDLRYTNGLAVSRMKTMAQVRKTSGRFETNSKRVI